MYLISFIRLIPHIATRAIILLKRSAQSGYVQHDHNPVRAHPNQFGGSDVQTCNVPNHHVYIAAHDENIHSAQPYPSHSDSHLVGISPFPQDHQPITSPHDKHPGSASFTHSFKLQLVMELPQYSRLCSMIFNLKKDRLEQNSSINSGWIQPNYQMLATLTSLNQGAD